MARFDSNYEIDNPELKQILREVGTGLGDALPPGYGFCLMLFGFTTKEFFYISNANRVAMVKALDEFKAKLLKGNDDAMRRD